MGFSRMACIVSKGLSAPKPEHVICSCILRRLHTMIDVTEGSSCANMFRMQDFRTSKFDYR